MSSIARTAPSTPVRHPTVSESVYTTLRAAIDTAAGNYALSDGQKHAMAWLEAHRDPTIIELQQERYYAAYLERRLDNATPLQAGKIQSLLSETRKRIDSLLAQALR